MKKIFITLVLILIGAAIYWQNIPTSIIPVSMSPKTHSCSSNTEMLFVKGGKFDMGAGAVYPEERPMVQREIDDFYMSRNEVTNFEFSKFVEETGYKTIAERHPNPKDYPDISPQDLKPGSAVFVKLTEAVKAATFMNWWHFIEGAYWREPNGPGSNILGKEHFPVVHIAYQDALAYADWKGHRLPTEAEYEYASRGGLNGEKYASGATLKVDGIYQSNTWQGLFPFNDSAEDGYEGLAPVGCFKANPYGLHDLIGNVWEWTTSTYYPQHFESESIPKELPENGFDPRQPGVKVGVVKGGSYLCAEDFCMRYRPAARHAQDTGMGTSHIGFRTVTDKLSS